MTIFTAACIQITSKTDVHENLKVSTELIRQAAAAGATFVGTPEVTNMMEPHKAAAREKAQLQTEDMTLAAYRRLASELTIWILAGSLVIKKPDDVRLANRSFLIRPDGSIAAQYDKIHMFDVELDSGESHKESRAYAPGDEAVLAETDWGLLGLTICYDVRFSHLYQTLVQAGAGILTVPAAFTHQTGLAHWKTLLRARAIENGAFVIAPAQCGQHSEKRKTFGHSMIIDPWGSVLAEMGEEPGFITAEINTEEIARRRQQIPNLQNNREFSRPKPTGVATATEQPI